MEQNQYKSMTKSKFDNDINKIVSDERAKFYEHNNANGSLLLVGVVEFHESGKIQRIRIRDNDIFSNANSDSCKNIKTTLEEFSNKSKNDSSSSFPCLRQCLLIQLYRAFINENELSANISTPKSNSQTQLFTNNIMQSIERNEYHLAENDTTTIVEVFDPISNKFIILPSECFKNDLHRFGKRIRCRVSHFPPKNKQAALVNTQEKTEIKCIQGRFFPFHSTGIPYAGKMLKIEEKLNSGEVRTGLNVWDGSLLL